MFLQWNTKLSLLLHIFSRLLSTLTTAMANWPLVPLASIISWKCIYNGVFVINKVFLIIKEKYNGLLKSCHGSVHLEILFETVNVFYFITVFVQYYLFQIPTLHISLCYIVCGIVDRVDSVCWGNLINWSGLIQVGTAFLHKKI